MSAVTSGGIKPGDTVVIRYEGPKGGPGMREMLGVTSAVVGAGAQHVGEGKRHPFGCSGNPMPTPVTVQRDAHTLAIAWQGCIVLVGALR